VSLFDHDTLLTPVNPEAPGGADLSYDDRFFAVEQASQPKESTFLGEREIPGEPPDYRTVLEQAGELFGETRDLRLAVMMTTAALAEGGFEGLTDGLALCRGMLEKFWGSMFPELDPDDPDPIERSNALANLNSRANGCAARLVRETPLSSDGLTLRDYDIVSGRIEAPQDDEGEEPLTLGEFTASMDQTPREHLDATASALRRAIEETEGIEKAYEAQSSSYQTLEPLREELQSCLRCVEEALERRGDEAPEAVDAGADGAGGGPAAHAGAPGKGLPGAVTSREEAAKAIELAIRYFERVEPSHPAPLLLRRAQALINKPFLDVIDELFQLDDIPSSVRRALGIAESMDEE